jgi:hypothetical protein
MLRLGRGSLFSLAAAQTLSSLCRGYGWWGVSPGNGEFIFAKLLGYRNWLNGTTCAVKFRAYLWERKLMTSRGPLSPLGSSLPASCTWRSRRERMSPVSRMCGGCGPAKNQDIPLAAHSGLVTFLGTGCQAYRAFEWLMLCVWGSGGLQSHLLHLPTCGFHVGRDMGYPALRLESGRGR